MSLTFKIAIGVFLGAIAAFLAINVPGWIQQSRRERWHMEAEQAISGLTPDIVIQRCGKSDKDVFDRGTGLRVMNYDSQHVVAAFWHTHEGPWTFGIMQFGGQMETVNGTTAADGKIISGAFEQITMLPGLEGKS